MFYVLCLMFYVNNSAISQMKANLEASDDEMSDSSSSSGGGGGRGNNLYGGQVNIGHAQNNSREQVVELSVNSELSERVAPVNKKEIKSRIQKLTLQTMGAGLILTLGAAVFFNPFGTGSGGGSFDGDISFDIDSFFDNEGFEAFGVACECCGEECECNGGGCNACSECCEECCIVM